MEVLALRHGQSEYNLLGLCNDDPQRAVGLTELGRQQARQAGLELAAWSIDRIFHSPLPRARQSAELINQTLDVPLVETPELCDIRSGFDGRPVTEYFAAIAADPLDAKVAGGESLRDYQQRVNRFLESLARESWQCVVLVAHEETLRVCKAWHEDLSPDQVLGLPFGNCELYPFEL